LVDASAAFRRGNEAVAQVARRANVSDVKADFFCECADPDCLGRVPLDLRSFERMRAEGTSVTVPDHDSRRVP
jgi:hypothetical protein